jgi:hypothetical protein
MDDDQNVLATIPSDIITLALQTLPDAQTAPDEPHLVQIQHNQRWVRITFKRFKHTNSRTRSQYRRGKPTPRWLWTAEHAQVIE